MASRDGKPVVFVSYSHRDRRIKDRLVEHISVLGATDFELWDDSAVRTGDDWRRRIEEAVARADASVLLISTDFLTSNFIASVELPALLAKPVYPILIGYCAWQKVGWLAKLQVRTDGGKPLGTRGRKLDRALVDIAVEMADLYGAKAQPAAPAVPEPPPPEREVDHGSTVLIEPADTSVAIVIQRDRRTGPVFNIACRVRSQAKVPQTLDKVEIQLTDPDGATLALKWNLFYEGTLVQRKISDAHPLVLPPGADDLIGIQFVGPDSVVHYRWSQGAHRCTMKGWVAPANHSEPPQVVTPCEIVVSADAARNLIYWGAAGSAQWKALNDPDNAVGIPAGIYRRSPAFGQRY